jgi:NADH:ubiquinone oxidoreductase subunit 6 (subunit J)
MVYMAVFAAIALLEVLSAAMVLIFRNMLHVVLAISALFMLNSAVFMMLGQPLLALLQLFIMIGGVSTYLFVGVASEGYSKFRGTNYKLFAVSYLVIFVLFSLKLGQIGLLTSQQNVVSGQLIAQSIGSNIGMLYLTVIMLFGVGLGSIIVMGKIGDKK